MKKTIYFLAPIRFRATHFFGHKTCLFVLNHLLVMPFKKLPQPVMCLNFVIENFMRFL